MKVPVKITIALHAHYMRTTVDHNEDGQRLPGEGATLCVMAFELTGQIEQHLVHDHIVWLTTVTPADGPRRAPSGSCGMGWPSPSTQCRTARSSGTSPPTTMSP